MDLLDTLLQQDSIGILFNRNCGRFCERKTLVEFYATLIRYKIQGIFLLREKNSGGILCNLNPKEIFQLSKFFNEEKTQIVLEFIYNIIKITIYNYIININQDEQLYAMTTQCEQGIIRI